MKKKKPKKRIKPIDWGRAFHKALEQEKDADALRAVELIRELYWLICIKHIKK